MPKTNLNNLLKSLPPEDRQIVLRIVADFPEFNWRATPRFAWVSKKNTIQLGEPQPNYALLALHELSHAILNHKDYIQDISRLKMERDAWNHAKTALCPRYQIPFNEDFAETQLDSYRNWLHQKSKCPACAQTRFQDRSGAYHCPFCEK
ncbi:MAG: hypothetical protein LBQ02_04195 [Candidatus Nomurabacteria bacterium]|nr:hypothetical protein [Candidatus Nomurabacteria bacterium]